MLLGRRTPSRSARRAPEPSSCSPRVAPESKTLPRRPRHGRLAPWWSLIVVVISIVAAALVVGSGTSNATSNVVGACLNSPSGSIPLSRAPRVDCSQPHDYEIYKVWDFPADGYPGDEVVTPVIDDTCRTSFETFVGISHLSSTLAYSYEAPSGGASQDGNHRAYCFISGPAGQVSGSLAGSKR